MDSFVSLVSFPCVVKLYAVSGQPPKQHSCRFSLGHLNHVLCFQFEGTGVQCKRLKFTADNLKPLAMNRINEGRLSISLEDLDWQTITITDVKDKLSLKKCYELLRKISAGTFSTTSGSPSNVKTTPSRTPPSCSNSMMGSGPLSSGKRKLKLIAHPNNWRGAAMVAAAQNTSTSSGTHASDFYKTTTPKAEPFLPRLTATHRPGYFSKAKRNLSLNLETENEDLDDFKPAVKLRSAQSPPLLKSRTPLTDLPAKKYGSIFQDRTPDSIEGFANLGNTCYMNAVLQSLLGLEPFAEDVLNFKLVKQVHPSSLYRMIFLLLKSKRAKDSYESQRILLKKIKETISARAIKFLGYRQQDAQEFLGQALDQLKDDLENVDVSDQVESLCPVIRNFECEILHTIACKSCSKVTNNAETIYDFALQLPLSVYHQHNEQANLQQLFDGYFLAEEVEYTCTACDGKFATLSHKLQKLPRVLVLHLKRYGYNVQLSKHSKRVDNIRIPRFINVGELCVEEVSPPCEFKGPWPRDPEALSAMATDSENKENVNNRLTESTFFQLTPPAVPPGPLSSSENTHQDNTITIPDSPKAKELSINHIPAPGPLCAESDSTTNSNGPTYTPSHQVESATCVQSSHSKDDLIIVTSQSNPLPSSIKLTSQSARNDVIDLTCSETKNLLTRPHTIQTDTNVVSSSHTVTVAKTSSSDTKEAEERSLNGNWELESSDQSTTSSTLNFKLGKRKTDRELKSESDFETMPPTQKLRKSDGRSTSECVTSNPPASPVMQSSVEADSQRTRREEIEEEFDKLFSPQVVFDFESQNKQGQTCSDQHDMIHATTVAHAATSTPLTEKSQLMSLKSKEEEEAELQKAMEASIKEQPNDFQLLHQLGISEDEQLRLALELSMQDVDTVSDDTQAPPTVSPCGKDGLDLGQENNNTTTETPEHGSLETYKLVSIVSHIGRESGGGHYISDVYTVADRMWKTYNDSQVSETKEELVRQRRQKSGYIFFYMHRSTYNNIAKHFRH